MEKDDMKEEEKRDGTDSVWSPTESVHVQWNRGPENADSRKEG